MMKNKEQLFSVSFDKPIRIKLRVINEWDSEEETKDKKKYPFRLQEEVEVRIKTTVREFSFKIYESYKWNGADIPRFLWWLGSSRDNDYAVASMVHDYMLQYKKEIFSEILEETMFVYEYRRLTSLIFREILKKHKMNVIKANIEAWFVDLFQAFFNKKSWRILGEV